MPEHVVTAPTKDLIKFNKLCGTAVSVCNMENCELHTLREAALQRCALSVYCVDTCSTLQTECIRTRWQECIFFRN
jgi:hypothetical protein